MADSGNDEKPVPAAAPPATPPEPLAARLARQRATAPPLFRVVEVRHAPNGRLAAHGQIWHTDLALVRRFGRALAANSVSQNVVVADSTGAIVERIPPPPPGAPAAAGWGSWQAMPLPPAPPRKPARASAAAKRRVAGPQSQPPQPLPLPIHGQPPAQPLPLTEAGPAAQPILAAQAAQPFAHAPAPAAVRPGGAPPPAHPAAALPSHSPGAASDVESTLTADQLPRV